MDLNYDITGLIEYSFESIEKQIYDYICSMGKKITAKLLEQLDLHLMKNRDVKRFASKQKRKTTVKTMYGEVEYHRRQYFDSEEKRYVYLLDESLQIERIGTISVNLAKRIAEATLDMPFRKAADVISQTTGQVISSHGAWNVTQQIGGKIRAEEEVLVEEMKRYKTRGKKESKIIFMETDGIYINIQKNKKKAKSQELKVSTTYTGWEENGKRLNGKKMYAGMETARIFNQKTEAQIQSVYNIDEAELRVLNGDGAAWIRNTTESERIYQLDRFHIKKEIRRCIPDMNIRRIILEKFNNNDMDGMLKYIESYINSIDEGKKDQKLENAESLYNYLSNNYDGLLPWQEQAENIPSAPEGIIYKNMGVQENQNCSLICIRIKGRKMRWSVSGANNMSKLLYMRENGDLDRIIEQNIKDIEIPELESDTEKTELSACKIKKKTGKGNKWISSIQASIPITNGPNCAYSKILREISNI